MARSRRSSKVNGSRAAACRSAPPSGCLRRRSCAARWPACCCRIIRSRSPPACRGWAKDARSSYYWQIAISLRGCSPGIRSRMRSVAGGFFSPVITQRWRAVFDLNPGLPLPQQFIKLPTIDPTAGEAAMAWAQRVFAERMQLDNTRHATALSSVAPPQSPPLVVAAGQRFGLWNDAGFAAAGALPGEDARSGYARRICPPRTWRRWRPERWAC